jgi:hypothetical protein
MCNGANLAFTKNVYLNSISELSTNTPSGDDIFLMLEIKKQNRNQISFLKSVKAVAYTKAENNIKNFLIQRKRWTSKSKYYTDFDIIATALLVFLANAILLSLFFASFIKPVFLMPFVLLFLVKSFADIFLLNSFGSFFQKKYLLKYFIFTQAVYPLYIVFTAIFGMFGTVQWKQRIYK